jgi:hypothetical protein
VERIVFKLSRAAVVATFGVLPLLWLQPRSAQPSSSLRPPPKDKVSVKISHEARRALSCSAVRKDGQLSCRAKYAAADSRTSLTWSPVLVGSKDHRRGAHVRFPERIGRQEHRLRVGAGGWQLDWPPHESRTFSLRAGDALEIALRTTLGKCQTRGASCALLPEEVARSVTTPSARP